MQALRTLWRRTSLRTKLVMLMCALMICGIGATAFGSAHTLRISMTNQIDDQLNVSGPTMGFGLNKAYQYSLDNDQSGENDGIDPTLLGLNRSYADIRDENGKIVYIMPRSRVTPGNNADTPLLAPEQMAELAKTPGPPSPSRVCIRVPQGGARW